MGAVKDIIGKVLGWLGVSITSNQFYILTDKEIIKMLESGEMKITPNPLEDDELKNLLIQPSSIDLRLDNQIYRIQKKNFPKGGGIDISNSKEISEMYKLETVNWNEPIVIQPYEFMLASTIEYVELPPTVSGFITGRSSVGRLGVFVENAGWIDAGFKGTLTLELFNATPNPIKLYPKMKICQIVLFKHPHPLMPYFGKYQFQRSTTPSKLFQDFD